MLLFKQVQYVAFYFLQLYESYLVFYVLRIQKDKE